jgi:outer membrane protein TolC
VLIKIATYKKQKEYLTNSLEFSNKSLEEAKRRFVGGIGEYNTLLDLTKAKFSMEINILNIEKGIILSYIELYKSIGKR